LSDAAFRQNELDILQILSGSASIALKNALLYKKEQLRGKELAGLARLVKTVGMGGDTSDLYAQLIDSIAPLVEVEYLGFILYDENRHTLEGQHPFLGLHQDVIEWTSTAIQPDSAAEKLWLSQEAIIAPQAVSDARLQAFGFDNLAVAAGIKQMVLMPLSSGGRRLGYLLAGDKRDQTPFSPDDIRLIGIAAGQAGPIVENAELIRQSEHRAQRAETLRRIASLTGSSATIDEILKYSLQDLGRLLNADKVGVLLLDDKVAELRLHKPSLFGISPEFASRQGKIATDEPGYSSSATYSQNYLFSDDIRNDIRFPSLYHTMLFSLGIKSVIIAPLVSRDRGIGEVVIGSYQPHFFAHGDVQTVITACGQLATVIESTSLYSQTDESLRQRVEQLTSLARFSRELNTNLDLTHLLQQVYNEMLQSTHADCGTIALFDIQASQAGLP
ncbi:MAG: GAF domain-containing protein, partial [Anaerolineales bacterium]